VLAKASGEYRDTLRELLGEERVTQRLLYERAASQRQFVQGVAGSLAAAGAPLSTAQADQLLQVFSRAYGDQQTYQQSLGRNIDWSAVDAQVRAIMSDAQFANYRAAETRFSWQFSDLCRQALAAEKAAR
jgi:hypothetical protein